MVLLETQATLTAPVVHLATLVVPPAALAASVALLAAMDHRVVMEHQAIPGDRVALAPQVDTAHQVAQVVRQHQAATEVPRDLMPMEVLAAPDLQIRANMGVSQ